MRSILSHGKRGGKKFSGPQSVSYSYECQSRGSTNRKNHDEAQNASSSFYERISKKEWTSEQIRDEIRRDLRLGMDSLYRVNIKEKKMPFRIVAPFVEHALNPPRSIVQENESQIGNEASRRS